MGGSEANCCKHHSGIDNRLGQLEIRADKHDTKLDSIEKRTVSILTGVVILLIGVLINIVISVFRGGTG